MSKKYLAVFSTEIRAEDWKKATRTFELYLKELNTSGISGVKGKLLKEIEDKESKDIITVDGLKYKRVFE